MKKVARDVARDLFGVGLCIGIGAILGTALYYLYAVGEFVRDRPEYMDLMADAETQSPECERNYITLE